MATRSTATAAVRAELERYAQRGVFRSFSETRRAGGSADFRFVWLWNLPFCLRFDPARRAFVFPKLLTGVRAGSDLETAIKAFLAECSSAAQPKHRRMDPKTMAVRYSNRHGTVTLTFGLKRGSGSDGVRSVINLANELFVGFLNLHHPEYLVAQFGLSQE